MSQAAGARGLQFLDQVSRSQIGGGAWCLLVIPSVGVFGAVQALPVVEPGPLDLGSEVTASPGRWSGFPGFPGHPWRARASP